MAEKGEKNGRKEAWQDMRGNFTRKIGNKKRRKNGLKWKRRAKDRHENRIKRRRRRKREGIDKWSREWKIKKNRRKRITIRNKCRRTTRMRKTKKETEEI